VTRRWQAGQDADSSRFVADQYENAAAAIGWWQ
jgi:hypothetical protein